MEELLTEWIASYGAFMMIALLFASGFGIPIGEEVVNIPAGMLAGRGELSLPVVYVCAYVGVLGGDIIWFAICRRFGLTLLRYRWFRRLVHPRRVLEAKHAFDRRGPWVLVLARFIPGSRSPALTIAGLLALPWTRFLAVELVCIALTTPIQVTIGYWIGRELASESLYTTLVWVLAVIAVIIAGSLLVGWLVRSRSRRGPTPRAKMRWLRRRPSAA